MCSGKECCGVVCAEFGYDSEGEGGDESGARSGTDCGDDGERESERTGSDETDANKEKGDENASKDERTGLIAMIGTSKSTTQCVQCVFVGLECAVPSLVRMLLRDGIQSTRLLECTKEKNTTRLFELVWMLYIFPWLYNRI